MSQVQGVCEFCSISFSKPASMYKDRTPKFCSWKCYVLGRPPRTKAECCICKKPMRLTETEVKKGKQHCGRACWKVGRTGDKSPRWQGGKRYSSYLSSAKRRSLPIDLSPTDIIVITSAPCAYCGTTTLKRGIDRVDNSMGYIKGNVTAACRWCNVMKQDKSVVDFISQIETIHLRIRQGMVGK